MNDWSDTAYVSGKGGITMIKEAMAGRSLIAVGAAVVFTGAALYAVGQTLDFLFRDVDPDRIEKGKEESDDSDAEATVAEAMI